MWSKKELSKLMCMAGVVALMGILPVATMAETCPDSATGVVANDCSPVDLSADVF